MYGRAVTAGKVQENVCGTPFLLSRCAASLNKRGVGVRGRVEVRRNGVFRPPAAVTRLQLALSVHGDRAYHCKGSESNICSVCSCNFKSIG